MEQLLLHFKYLLVIYLNNNNNNIIFSINSKAIFISSWNSMQF